LRGRGTDLTKWERVLAMSPELKRALEGGGELTREQFREYIDHEAKAARIRGGGDVAIKRAQDGKDPASYREMRLRLSIDAYLR
jgi:hypothetical protein